MGRGRSRKQRNSATFRLCPRPGAADASDRVFVRVDDNPYSLPGFADDDRDYYSGVVPSSSAAADPDAGAPLPEHVRREILDLGLPDDGYDYLSHLREIRPSLSSTGGGGSSAAFLPARRPARFGLPLNVKAYDARGVGAGPDDVGAAAVAASPVEEAIDLDVAELLEESDAPTGATEDEDLEEDFVIIANQPEEEEQMDVEEDFVILASQREEEDQVDVEEEEEERLEDAGSDEVPWTDDQIEMIKLLHQPL